MPPLPVTGHTIVRKVIRAGMPVKANKPSVPLSRWGNDPPMPTTVLAGLRKVTAGVKGKEKAPSIPVSSISCSDVDNRASVLYSINIPLMAWIADKGFKSVIPDFDLFRSTSNNADEKHPLLEQIIDYAIERGALILQCALDDPTIWDEEIINGLSYIVSMFV